MVKEKTGFPGYAAAGSTTGCSAAANACCASDQLDSTVKEKTGFPGYAAAGSTVCAAFASASVSVTSETARLSSLRARLR